MDKIEVDTYAHLPIWILATYPPCCHWIWVHVRTENNSRLYLIPYYYLHYFITFYIFTKATALLSLSSTLLTLSIVNIDNEWICWYIKKLFHYSDGHDGPAVVTGAMLQYCRFLESMHTAYRVYGHYSVYRWPNHN